MRALSRPLTARRGLGMSFPVTSAWSSAGSGRRPSITTVTAGAGHRGTAEPRQKETGRVGHPDDASVSQLEAAHLVRGPEAVLDPTHHPERGVLVPFEREHDVDEVLEHPWARDRAVLGDMSHQHDRQAALLREPGERDGDRAGLRHAAGGAVRVARGHRLHRVDHEQVRTQFVDVSHDRAEVGLGGEVELVVDGSGALGAQSDLARALLARDVQDAT